MGKEGHMHGGVGQVEEKALVCPGVGLNEFHRFPGVFTGDATLTFILEEFSHLFVTHQGMNPLAVGGGSAAHVIGVGDAEVAIKTLARRQEFALIPQMPLAYTHGGVAQFLQVIGHCMLRGVESIAAGWKENAGDTHPRRVAAGQELGTRGRANRGGVETGELAAFPGHAVEVWRAVQSGAVGADIAIAHVINEDENQIRLFLCGEGKGKE